MPIVHSTKIPIARKDCNPGTKVRWWGGDVRERPTKNRSKPTLVGKINSMPYMDTLIIETSRGEILVGRYECTAVENG